MPTMSVSSRLGLSRPRLLDRYIVREMLAPSAIGLLVFTFVLLMDQIPRLLAVLVARSADLATILRVFLNLLPSILAVTLPMAFLLGVLLAFGRLASDSEIIALRAVGVSPLRLLAPVMMLAAGMTALTFYINAVALPRANQSYRELVFSLVVSKARTDVKARTFTDSLLPGRMMLYVQDIEPDTGRWRNLLIHDTRDLREPKLILAKTGELVVDRDRQIVRIELGPGSQHSFFPSDPREYNRTAFGSMGWDLPVDEFFPDRKKLLLSKGDREMTLGELGDRIAQMRSAGQARKEWGRFSVEWHKKFAIPAACLVFGLLGLALSLGSKKEARSSAFALSIGVIFAYYVLIRLGEQAGDTGMISPFALDVGRQPRPGGGRADASLAEPPGGRLRPAGPRALPRLRAEGPEATRGPARPGRAERRARCGGEAGRRGPHPEAHPALPFAPRPLHRRLLGGERGARPRRLHVHLLPRGVHGPDRRHPAAQRQGQGPPPLLRVPRLVDRLHRGAGRGADRGPGHAGPAGPPQRDHRHEGRRHQRLPRGGARARDGPRWRASCSTGCRSGCSRSRTRRRPSSST